jgi:hypothetical protein
MHFWKTDSDKGIPVGDSIVTTKIKTEKRWHTKSSRYISRPRQVSLINLNLDLVNKNNLLENRKKTTDYLFWMFHHHLLTQLQKLKVILKKLDVFNTRIRGIQQLEQSTITW